MKRKAATCGAPNDDDDENDDENEEAADDVADDVSACTAASRSCVPLISLNIYFHLVR